MMLENIRCNTSIIILFHPGLAGLYHVIRMSYINYSGCPGERTLDVASSQSEKVKDQSTRN